MSYANPAQALKSYALVSKPGAIGVAHYARDAMQVLVEEGAEPISFGDWVENHVAAFDVISRRSVSMIGSDLSHEAIYFRRTEAEPIIPPLYIVGMEGKILGQRIYSTFI
jgi:hypothetical protein